MRLLPVSEWSCLCILGLLALAGCSTGDDAEYRSYEAVTQSETGTAEEPTGVATGTDGEAAPETENATSAETDSEPGGTPAEPAADPEESASVAMQTPSEAGESTTGKKPTATDTPSTPEGGKPAAMATAEGDPMPETVVEPRTAVPGERVVETGDGTAPAEAPKKPEGGVKLLVPEREFQVEGPEGALRVSFDDLDLLKVLNMDPVTADAPNLLPDWMRELDGKRIRLRGFMYPPPLETGLPGFVLARDNQICCFGRNPKPYDILPVQMRSGVTTDYIQGRPFDVVGVFHLRPDIEDGDVYQLYEIDDAVVIDQ
ncbi:hypothetical protein [Maioricimonas sp. JC845]|uniref:hypothetical protein n=1 Tax=Maioricimonas sp. JC845 TaxID=3232138 RepID=UPI00345A30EE